MQRRAELHKLLRFFFEKMLRLRKDKADYSDEALLEKYRQSGDTQWLGMLFERYVEWVYGLCLKYSERPEDAQDAAMGIFEELMDKTRKHDIQYFKSWLYTYARNYCLMRIRKQGRQQEAFNRLEREEEAFEESWDLEDSDTHLKQLQYCLEQLAAAQRECIIAFYYEDLSYQEISLQRQEQLGQVRSHLQNGRRNLRLCMDGN